MADGDLEFVGSTGHRGEVQPPHTNVVGEVFLVNLRIVSVGGCPRQVSSLRNIEGVSKLVVEVDGNRTYNAGRDGALAPAQLKVGRSTRFDGYRDINIIARGNTVRHTNDVSANSVGLEDVRHHGAHATVGWRIRDGFARDHVAVLVNHVRGDG